MSEIDLKNALKIGYTYGETVAFVDEPRKTKVHKR
jgi:hypothetical protein